MKIGVVGGTGEVGRMMLHCLSYLKVNVTELHIFASKKSAGKNIMFAGKKIKVELLTEEKMKDSYDYLLFSAGGAVSKHYAPIAANAGNVVIDNSSTFRMDKNVPLIIPEINSHILKGYKGIIANPNCSTIQMLLALYPIHKINKIKRIVVSTYQSVSGSGRKGINTMESQESGSTYKGVYSRSIHRNVIPEIGVFLPDGNSEEEMKMVNETHKIFNDENIKISATTVRVPVKYGHAESIYFETETNMKKNELVNVMLKAESVIFYEKDYITPIELDDIENSHVCRLRNAGDDSSFSFWNVANNIGVGAATNAVRILIKMEEMKVKS